MKLYTEEQVKKAIELADKYHYLLDSEENEIVNSLTPIQLPSDEEIEERYYKELEDRREAAKNFKGQVAGRHPDMFVHHEVHHMVSGYLECIKWLRDKIQGGNK